MNFILTKTYVYYRGKENEQHIPKGSFVTLNKWHKDNKLFVNYDNDIYLVHIKDLIMATQDSTDKDNGVAKKCWLCDSHMIKVIDNIELKDRTGEYKTLKNIPLFRCSQCGEETYTSNTAKFIQGHLK